MFELIQLFKNDDFYKKMRLGCSKINKDLMVNQTAASLYFSGGTSFRRDKVYLFDNQMIDQYFEELHQLSTCNFLVFVYENEDQIIGNERLARLADQYLPLNFSSAQLYTTISLTKKSLKGHADTVFPRKLINTSVSEIEQLLNSVSQRVFWKNIRGMYIGCNNSFANDFQFNSVENVMGKTDYELFDEKNAIEFSAYDAQIIKTGKPVENFHKEVSFIDGKRKWLIISKFPHMKEGVVIGIIGKYELINIDREANGNPVVSDQKLLQVLMDNIPDTIYFKDVESKFIAINRAQADLIGIESTDEAIGKTDFDFFNIEFAKESFAAEQKIIFEGEPQNKIDYLGTKDGHYRWMYSKKIPIKDDKGLIVGIAGVSHNITELIETEQQLKSERDMLQLLIDIIPSPIYIKNAQSEFVRVNKAMVQLLGVKSANEVIGKTDSDFYEKAEASIYRTEDLKIFETGVPLINKMEQSDWGIDNIKWVSTTKIPYKNDKGVFCGLVGISNDITESMMVKQRLEFAKQKAEDASKAKSNFLSNMSHEIRTPMNGIIGMTELLQLTKLDQEQQKIVEIISRSGSNLLKIINDILDLSRIENGKLELDNSSINIKDVIDEVIDIMTLSAQDNGNELHVKYDYNIPETVIGDSLRLKQILINLLSNAIKFTRKGEVQIETKYIGNSETHHCVKFKVIDNGIGLDISQIDNIFESFTQADASTTRKYGGTGLGLAISSQLISMMGGKLKVQSKKDEGSTFYFELLFEKIAVKEHNMF